ncbi:MAG: indole-3-glycerol phosphate synthase TrpC [Methanobrevibacter sp.]|jgi:indole-3-glycerol phosphate synthase|nr:indole-3-glycerol phosphate synthase TrpC [Methanobrevibacter sp.]
MILDKIVEKKKERLKEDKSKISLNDLKNQLDLEKFQKTSHEYPFEEALKKNGLSIIAEIKKASPSKGLISKDFDPEKIAIEYESAGVSAISVLTEEDFFMGKKEYLEIIAKKIKTPLLRKDFIIDEYMIYESKILHASAILLIVSILTEEKLKKFLKIAKILGLSALVEAHDEKEVKIAINSGARIIGVNNRNLKDFTVDLNNSIDLRKLVSKDIIFISESGIKTIKDIERLKKNNVDGVLIGESFMKSKNKKNLIKSFKSI